MDRWSRIRRPRFARRSASILDARCRANTSSRCTSCRRTHPPDKQVLKDISLSFFPGAKIGVLGLNGSGKSTLLRIMAGQRQRVPRRGAARARRDRRAARAGAAARRVQGRARQRRGRRAPSCATLLDRFNELAANYSDETADEFARLQDQIDAADAWNLDTQLDRRWTRCACPPADADVTKLSGGERRRVALCRLLLARARPAAARRADQPPRRRVGRLARAPPRGLQGHRRRRHPRSLLPRQRRGLDPRARPRPRASRSRATTRAGSSRSRSGSRRRRSTETARQRTIARELEWVRENPKGRRKKSKARLNHYERAARRGAQRQARPGPDPHPGRAAARRHGDRGRGPAQGLRRPAADRGPLVLAAARRASSA